MSLQTHLVLVIIVIVFIVSSFCDNIELEGAIDNYPDVALESEYGILEGRRRKKHDKTKYLIPMLFAAVLIKTVLFPLAFKVMAMMAGVSVIMSTFSLLLSSIVGYSKLAKKSTRGLQVYYNQKKNDYWSKDDQENSTPELYLPNDGGGGGIKEHYQKYQYIKK